MPATIHARERASASGVRATPQTWRCAYDIARAYWDWGPLDFDDFCEHVVRLGHTALPRETEALYLSAGCAYGIEGACATLDQLYFPHLKLAIRSRYPGQCVDDMLQDVRARLFVGPQPRIGTYRGTGPLSAWLRTVALNIVRDRMRMDQTRQGQLIQLSAHVDTLRDRLMPQLSPEELLADAELGSVCERALHQIVRSIDGRDLQLLRHYFVNCLSIDEIGAVYAVDRSTAARWINRVVEAIRLDLVKALRGLLSDTRWESLSGVIPHHVFTRLCGLDPWLSPAEPVGQPKSTSAA